jgi:hypothetical protein
MKKIIDKTNFDIADFDEEMVIVNINKGTYYSLNGASPFFFRLFMEGVDLSALNELVEKKYGAAHFKSFNNFVNSLIAEELLIDTSETTKDLNIDLPEIQFLDKGFIIEKQDDISDLIKLDPIHDVLPDKGWPYRKK